MMAHVVKEFIYQAHGEKGEHEGDRNAFTPLTSYALGTRCSEVAKPGEVGWDGKGQGGNEIQFPAYLFLFACASLCYHCCRIISHICLCSLFNKNGTILC